MIFGGFISYWMGKTRNVSRGVGFRTPSTLSNADVWEAVNKNAGIAIMIEGSGIILASLIFRDLLVANHLAFIALTQVILLTTVIKYARDASKMSKSLALESKT